MRAESSRPVDWAEEMLRSLDEPMAKNDPVELKDKVINPSVASVIQRAIEKRWSGTDKELSVAAKVSDGGLSLLKNNGCEGVTNVLKKVAKVLSIDAKAASQGKLVPLADDADDENDEDIVAVAKSLKGSSVEDEAKSLLKKLRRLGEQLANG